MILQNADPAKWFPGDEECIYMHVSTLCHKGFKAKC